MHRGEQILNCNMPNIDDGVTYKNEGEEAVLMVEESPSGGGVHTNPLGIHCAFSFEHCSSFPKNVPIV